jgi:hypothetical protein
VIRDFNDMMSQVYPPKWKRLDLVRREAGKALAVAEQPGRQWLNKASLVLADSNGKEKRVLLLGLGEVRLGRHRERSDIVLRVLPRSKQNDRLSCRITAKRPHLRIALQADGLFVIDQDTPGGTRLDDQPVRGAARIDLGRTGALDVAGAVRLRLTPCCDDQSVEALTAEQCERLGRADGAWRTAEGLGLRGLLIERVDNLADEERYLVVYRWVDCGADVGGGFVSGMGCSGEPAPRVLRVGGRLWGWVGVEAARPGDSESVEFVGGWAFPLSVGQRIRGGVAAGRIEEWRQFGL